uniref:Uncharacterized protein n=1 Tax=Oryza punctata TaxID=4537 RepID=A0A0E0LP46_ORYPU
MAALRQLCRKLTSGSMLSPAFLVIIRRSSTVSPGVGSSAAGSEGDAVDLDSAKSFTYCLPDAGASDTGSKDDEPEYCYTLGAHGRLRFPRSAFIPIDQFLEQNPPLEETLKPSIPSPFKKGNVGILSDLHIVVFLELDDHTSPHPSSDPTEYPLIYAGISDFIFDRIADVHGLHAAKHPPGGLQELWNYRKHAKPADELIIYHLEFCPLEVLSVMYLEFFRILRRELPALGQESLAKKVIADIDHWIGGSQCILNACRHDKVLRNWLGVHTRKVYGLLNIPIPVSPKPASTPSTLTKSETSQLKLLLKKWYNNAQGQSATATATTSSAQSTATTSSAQATAGSSGQAAKIQKTMVIDIHRHVTAYIIEDRSVKLLGDLPKEHQKSFKLKPLEWQDANMRHYPLEPLFVDLFPSTLFSVVKPTRDASSIGVVVAHGANEAAEKVEGIIPEVQVPPPQYKKASGRLQWGAVLHVQESEDKKNTDKSRLQLEGSMDTHKSNANISSEDDDFLKGKCNRKVPQATMCFAYILQLWFETLESHDSLIIYHIL